jgi:hypothetical protein
LTQKKKKNLSYEKDSDIRLSLYPSFSSSSSVALSALDVDVDAPAAAPYVVVFAASGRTSDRYSHCKIERERCTHRAQHRKRKKKKQNNYFSLFPHNALLQQRVSVRIALLVKQSVNRRTLSNAK